MREKERAQRILQVLSKEFGVPEVSSSRSDAFQALVRTVLSQATNDRNRDRAYANLTRKYRIEPEALAKADLKELEEAIRVGGLYRNKARKIKELSKIVCTEFHGSLGFIFSETLEKSRVLLMSIPGVGPKTADIVLLFVAKKPTVPVDTHVFRVSRRLGLAPLRASYEGIRGSLEALYKPSDYFAIHLLLITLGRRFCRARNPLHETCPVNALCPTAKREKREPDLHKLHGSREYP